MTCLGCPLGNKCEWPECEEDGDECFFREPTEKEIEQFITGLLFLNLVYEIVRPR